MTTHSLRSQRAAIFLVSFVVIFVEIALMRELALRFWEHLAWLVISIALLGFGTSGTVLILLQRWVTVKKEFLQYLSLVFMAVSFPLCLMSGDRIDLDLIQMVWQPTYLFQLAQLELVLGVPFLFGGMFIGLALQDGPEKIPGHYAANFIGSGAGAIAILPALFLASPRVLILGSSFVVFGAGLLCVRGKSQATGWLVSGVVLITLTAQVSHVPKVSEDKDLPQILAMPGSEVLSRRYGPQGVVELVRAPAVHTAPGMALNAMVPIPEQLFVTVDARIVDSLYKVSSHGDYSFLDQTTQAVAYRLGDHRHVLIGNDGGTDKVGLALYHGVDAVTALSVNEALVRIKSGAVASEYSANTYNIPEVILVTATIRSWLRNSGHRYSLIILPDTGNDPGGLEAATTDSLFTLESFRLCFDRLEDNGVLLVTTDVQSPPRESFRLINMFADMLEESGRKPRQHFAIVRNWSSLTIAVTKSALSPMQLAAVRDFSSRRGFDLVWLPDLSPMEVNRHHILADADYYLGASALLREDRKRWVEKYIYDLTSPDDNTPFFHHFSRWRKIHDFSLQLGKRGRAYIEIGGVLLAAAMVQSSLLAFFLILLPLFPAIGLRGTREERLTVIGFFGCIGLGFMFLEMGMLQRLTIHFTHPVYAAATVLSGFLFFGGLGSGLSSRFREPFARLHCGLGLAIVGVGILTVTVVDRCHAFVEGFSVTVLMLFTLMLISPLATLMGMMFPLGMKRVGLCRASLIPWAWSVNGFTSVLATLGAPFMAMQWGFKLVTSIALGCYLLAAMLSIRLPNR